MHTFARPHRVLDPYLFRWLARASAAVLFVTWLALVAAEAVISRFAAPSIHTVYQGIALAIVFAGYAVGWRKELAGGMIAILGTLAFFAVHATTIGTLPGLPAALFAAPGVLYLLAWYSEGVSRSPVARQR